MIAGMSTAPVKVIRTRDADGFWYIPDAAAYADYLKSIGQRSVPCVRKIFVSYETAEDASEYMDVEHELVAKAFQFRKRADYEMV
jgi:hypothetical protein